MSDARPLHGSRFLTSESGLGLAFFAGPDGLVTATLTPDLRVEGPPGHVHGGFSVALLDEAMGMAIWRTGHQVVSVNLTTDFRAPIPLGTEITVQGQIERVDGGKIHTTGRIILPGDRVAVEGRGLWIEMPDIFRDNQQPRFGSDRDA